MEPDLLVDPQRQQGDLRRSKLCIAIRRHVLFLVERQMDPLHHQAGLAVARNKQCAGLPARHQSCAIRQQQLAF